MQCHRVYLCYLLTLGIERGHRRTTEKFGGTESGKMFEQKINAPLAGKQLQAKLPFPLHFCILGFDHAHTHATPQHKAPIPGFAMVCNANVIKWCLKGIA